MGQPSHPNGSRVNSIQTADNTVTWYGGSKEFFFQTYLLSILFKFIRHWVTASLVIPYQNPWYNGELNRLSRLRSRRLRSQDKSIIPNLEWKNNTPKLLANAPQKKRTFNRVVRRYFRKLPPSLILRDNVENLIRPSIILKRMRYSFTFWNRPKLLRVTSLVFCILKGVGAGEKVRKPFPPRKWRVKVRKKGFWKRSPKIRSHYVPYSTSLYRKFEI